MRISKSSTVVRTAGLSAAPVDDEIVILNLPRNSYVGLDAVGRRIWQLLEQPAEVGSLCARLGDEFNGDAVSIEKDVIYFLNELLAEKLVSVVDSACS